MMKNRIRIIERICVIGIIALAAIIAVGGAILWRRPANQEAANAPAAEADDSLTEWADFLPDAIAYGE